MDHFNLRHIQNLINMKKTTSWKSVNISKCTLYYLSVYRRLSSIFLFSVWSVCSKEGFLIKTSSYVPSTITNTNTVKTENTIVQVCLTLMLQKGVTGATMRTLLRSPSWSVFQDLESSYCSTAQIYYGCGSYTV